MVETVPALAAAPAAHAPTTHGVRRKPLEPFLATDPYARLDFKNQRPACCQSRCASGGATVSGDVRTEQVRGLLSRPRQPSGWQPSEAPLRHVGALAQFVGGVWSGRTCLQSESDPFRSPCRTLRLSSKPRALLPPRVGQWTAFSAPSCRPRSWALRSSVPAWSVARGRVLSRPWMGTLCLVSVFGVPSERLALLRPGTWVLRPRLPGGTVSNGVPGVERSSDRRWRRGFARRGC